MSRSKAGGIWAIAITGFAVGLGGPASATPPAHEGPFGISMGESVAELHGVPMGRDIYRVSRPPTPNADFPLILVVAFPTTGVCQIMGSGNVNTDDPTGEKVQSDVDRLAGLLEAKYGPSKKQDDCNDSDEACNRVWTFDAKQGVASYSYNWVNSAAAKPQKIALITLMAQADSAASTEAVLGYDSSDEACAAARKAAEGTGL